MSWVRIWVHLVFSTKGAQPFLLTTELRQTVFNHIKENSQKKGILLNIVDGYDNHVHCLLLLGKEHALSKIVQLIKGESSHWINENKLVKGKFCWQDDYWAVSASESHINSVKEYISNQEMHHRKRTFKEEVDLFMKKYKWEYIEN